MSFKRTRTPSNSSSDTSSPAAGHTSKLSRASTSPPPGGLENHKPATTPPLLCSLPPTCNPPHNVPTPLANSKELETHYANYHAHVCEQSGCGCVFPDGRLLELHQTECHDPIAAVRKDRGEKIFACHLATCPRLFLTPKARRLHLIQSHAYPKQFFFAVTNKGIGGLLRRWGEGASMIRGQWKPREGKAVVQEPVEIEEEDEDEEGDARNGAGVDVVMDEVKVNGTTSENPESPEAMQTEPCRTRSLQNFSVDGQLQEAEPEGTETLDQLAQSMNSLSLVPPSIRFGRGGKAGGFVHHGTRSPLPASAPSPEGRGKPTVLGGAHRGRVGVANLGRGIGFERGRGRGPYSNANMSARRVIGSDEIGSRGIGRRGRGIIPVRGRGRGRGSEGR